MIVFRILLAIAALGPSVFDYDTRRPLDVRAEAKDEISFVNAAGKRSSAYLIGPQKPAKGPGILFVHWYEPESKDSNRTQFLSQAQELAHEGATCLLIDTMWSKPDWFPTRKPEDDYANSIQQVQELRRALDVLLSRSTVDPKRVAYVGHDFGAMYGAVLAGVDRRVHAWALEAGTTSFSSWFLLGAKLQGPERQAVVDKLAPLDPVLYIAHAAPSPILFQFGRKDSYVPEPRAQDFIAAAREPKSVLFYDAGHGLNQQAVLDRQAWLRKTLGLTQ
jgi:dienelactone hydrolase